MTGATRSELPGCCVDCVFWQHPRDTTDARAKQRWMSGVERAFGPWGRVVDDGADLRGMIQYGPATAFPRARVLPAGPPAAAGALITCAYLDGDDRVGAFERLLLEALADLKARCLPSADAFALNYPDEVPAPERFGRHQTLFDRQFLERFGFQPVRSHGQVSLMRLDLGGLEPHRAPGLVARAAARVRAVGPAARPEPV